MEYHLRSIDKEKNRYRFYSIIVEPGLFSSYSVKRLWGRIGSKSRSLTKECKTLEEVNKMVQRLIAIRMRHNYLMIASSVK